MRSPTPSTLIVSAEWGASMHRMKLSVAIAVVFSFIGVTGLSGAASAPITSKSPTQILAISMAAMRQAGSFHYLLTKSTPGLAPVSLSTDCAVAYGKQTQSLGRLRDTISLIGTGLYVYANETAWKENFGVKHPTLSDEWVSVPQSNKNYVGVAIDILLPSVVRQIDRVRGLKDIGEFRVNGQLTVALRGAVTASPAEFPGTQTLYVSTSAPYLPILVTETGSTQGEKFTNQTIFSKWGEHFVVNRPSHYVVATDKTFP